MRSMLKASCGNFFTIATGLFNAMPSDTPRYSELQSILPAFERFEDVSPELLAKDSLLREFIGGGKYSY